MAKTILITGAAGNLGGLLALHLRGCLNFAAEDISGSGREIFSRGEGGVGVPTVSEPGEKSIGSELERPRAVNSKQPLKDRPLHLLTHEKDVARELRDRPNIRVFKADLARRDTLLPALAGVDTVVHFAGVLFRARPEKFLPTTNTAYFRNLLDAAIEQGVRRVILISFPHVEGETSPQNPATGRLDGRPESVHAATRLEEEKELFRRCAEAGIEAVSLRVGMVYGRGILMIDAAEWFGRHRLLGVWREPTYIHLISKADFLAATTAAIDTPGANGIYHVGDEGVQTLQEFLDTVAAHKRYHKPWRMPLWMIMTAARVFELFSALFGTRAPLTRDFVRIGRCSYYGDTTRTREELLPELKYKSFRDALETF